MHEWVRRIRTFLLITSAGSRSKWPKIWLVFFFSLLLLRQIIGYYGLGQEVHLLQKGSNKSCVNGPLWCFFFLFFYSSAIWLKRWLKVLLPADEIMALMEVVQVFQASMRKLLSTVGLQDIYALLWTREVTALWQRVGHISSSLPSHQLSLSLRQTG